MSCRPGHSTPGTSQSGQRHSSTGGASPPTSIALNFSNDGGARGSLRFGPASPLARALSGMAVSIQRGISGAGGAVVRTLSGAGLMPPSHHGSASYERILDESGDVDMALPVSHHAAALDGRSHAGRSRLGAGQPQLHVQPSGLQPSRFFLPGVSAVPAESAQFAHPSSMTAAQRLQAGVGRPAPEAASLQGAQGEPVVELPRPPGLARIRTRPSDGSGSGAQQVAAGDVSLGVGQGTTLQGPSLGMQVAGGAGPSSAPVPGSDDAQHVGTAGGSSTRWRTRLEYQADLAASSSPVSAPGRAQQARNRRTPSEPGQQGSQRVRGNAGLNFVPTPTALDATNR